MFRLLYHYGLPRLMNRSMRGGTRRTHTDRTNGVCMWMVYGPIGPEGRQYEGTPAGVRRRTSFFMKGHHVNYMR